MGTKWEDKARAGDVAEGQPLTLDKVVGQDLMFISFEITESENYGHQAHLYCETKEGKEVELITFSGVVLDQVKGIEDKLPCIITPAWSGTYYTIY